MAPRLFKRLFHHRQGHSTASSLRSLDSADSSIDSSNTVTDEKPRSLAVELEPPVADSDHPAGLWDEVYRSYLASTDSQDLKAIAKLLRDQNRSSQHDVGQVAATNNDAATSVEWQICHDVLQMAQSKQSVHDDSSTMSRLRRAYAEVVVWVEKFVCVGDAVAQLDPVHVGLPWAGVRALLMISIHDQKTQADLAEKTADLSRLICRYAAFEDVYMREQSLLPETVRMKLNAALKTLYMSIFKYLIEAVLVLRSSTGARIGRSILMSDHLTDLYHEVERNEQDILGYERLSIRATSHAQYIDVRSKLCTYEDHLASEKRREISTWISTIDYYSQHREMNSRVLPYTGRWFMESFPYKDWVESDQSSILWLKGAAGTGKTSLISCVVQEHLDKSWIDGSEALAYFYCSRTVGDKSQQDPKAILLSILRQLSSPLPGLPIKSPVLKEYEKETARGSIKASMTVEETTNLVSRLIRDHYENVTLIVDALDECDSAKRAQLLDVLTRLTYGTGATVKTLVSSRVDPDIERHFYTTPYLSITATDNADDIAKFVDQEIDARLLGGTAGRALRDRVKSHLNSRAKGVFRWVALQVESLCDSDRVYSEADVEYLLPKLPETLGETYSQILKDLDRLTPHAREGVENTLKLMIALDKNAHRDFILESLKILSQPGQIVWEKKAILKMTKGLLTSEFGEGSLIFAHLSVKEYLESSEDFRVEAAHALATKVCVQTFLRFHEKQYESRGIQWYALSMIGVHCREAGTLRKELELQALLTEFFLGERESGFTRWNRERRLDNNYIGGSIIDDLTASSSASSLPLFMVCVYDLTEFVQPILNTYDSVFYVENGYKQSALEVATRYGRLEILQMLWVARPSEDWSPIDDATWIGAAARSDNLEVWNFVLSRVSDVPFVETLIQAANSKNHGKAMVKRLLAEQVIIQEPVMCQILQDCASFEILELVREHTASRAFTELMLQAAVCNAHLNPALTKSILNENPYLRVSEACFLEVLKTWEFQDPTAKEEIIKLLVNHPHRCPISEEIVCRAAGDPSDQGSFETIQLLLTQWPHINLTEDVLRATILSSSQGEEVLKMLLKHDPEAEMTGRHLADALARYRIVGSPYRYILERPKPPTLSDEDMYHILENADVSGLDDLIGSMLRQCEQFHITDRFLELFARLGSVEAIKRLLNLPRPFPITQKVVQAPSSGSDERVAVLRYLLYEVYSLDFEVTENFLVRLLDDMKSREAYIQVLIDGHKVLPVNETVMMAAAYGGYFHEGGGNGAFELLLSQHVGPIEQLLTNKVFVSAVESNNLDVIQCFKKYGVDIQVTEQVLEACLNNEGTVDVRVLKHLLSQPDRCSITLPMLEAAAVVRNTSVLHHLLNEPDGAALAANLKTNARKQRKSTLLWRMETYDVSDASEEQIVEALKRSWRNTNIDLIRQFASYQGPALNFERLIEIAAGQECAKFLIQYLRCQRPGAVITRHALMTAAANKDAGSSLMYYMLDTSEHKVDTELLTTVASNPNSASQLVKCLLARCPDMVVQDDTILAALRNEYCGRTLLVLFLEKRPDLNVTEQMVEAAASNEVSGNLLLQLLLQHTLRSSSTEEVHMTFSKIKSIENGARDALFIAACYGYDDVLDFLVSQNIDLSSVAGELGTALNVATRTNNIYAVKKLLEKGCDVSFRSQQYATPLDTACREEYKEVAEILVQYGAKIDLEDSSGFPRLRQALCHGSHDMADFLLSVGASTTIKDQQGMSSIHHVARSRYLEPELVDKVVARGADIHAEDNYQWNALHWAAYRGRTEIVSKLLDMGAKKDKLDVSGRAPYDIAMLVGNFHLRPHLSFPDRPDTAIRVTAEEHDEESCSLCHILIRGPLFQCLSCKDFKLCFRCIHDAANAHPVEHKFEEK